MIPPARAPRGDPADGRYVRVDPRSHAVVLRPGRAFADEFRPGDLLVLNDAATLPASFAVRTSAGVLFELRLAGPGDGDTWRAVAFGAGTWRARTEDRPPPPPLAPGDRINFAARGGLSARVQAVDAVSTRLLTLRFDRDGEELVAALYRCGRPVQYSHLADDLALWDVQTRFAARPWAVEPPTAGLALAMDTLLALRRRGVGVARVTHAAGLSSTGDAALDRRLPLPERFEVPFETVRAVTRARRRGGRVIAVGTTVTRALEGNAALHGGRLRAACGSTDHLLGPGVPRRVVDGLWTGLHGPGTSHFALAESFAGRALLERALQAAEAAGYVGEEFGDGMLLLDYVPAVPVAPGVNPAACARGVRERREAAASSSSQSRRPGAGRTRAAGGSALAGPGGDSSTAATASALVAPLATKITRRAAESAGKVSVSRRGDSGGPPSMATTERSSTPRAGEPGKSDAVWPSAPSPSHTRSSSGSGLDGGPTTVASARA